MANRCTASDIDDKVYSLVTGLYPIEQGEKQMLSELVAYSIKSFPIIVPKDTMTGSISIPSITLEATVKLRDIKEGSMESVLYVYSIDQENVVSQEAIVEGAIESSLVIPSITQKEVVIQVDLDTEGPMESSIQILSIVQV